ncbi:G-type lectin S-receptor-like serine/threonine-protein kinase At2g19130 [Miscanthus floridulus]|uniref:G-type lectin S-receptor-like serine/threonine-protein kinase At2g19130 n=1 Tax=Miscanthus floridulus TaxID=154761 RepID=UPI003459EC44
MATTITTLASGALCTVVILLVSLQGSLTGATDVITATQPLYGQQKLVSQGGKFALGFHQPGGGSDKWYIAIWYNKVQKVAPVWIANRETPISDPAPSVLTIWTDGNLVLLNKSRSIVWSSNTPTTAGASNTTIVAVLLNSGNLVLAYASNTSNTIWQSFDHATDTQLPGMKFGRNKLTGVSDRQVSWRNSTDPSPGIFSVVMDPRVAGQYLFVWNNSRPYFTPGKFNPQTGAFSGIPQMAVMSQAGSIYSYEYVDNDEEEYFLLTLKDDSVFLRTVIDPSGQQKGMVWMEEKQDWMLYFVQPSALCSVYSACGAFSWCAVHDVPMCSCLRGFSTQSPAEWSSGNYTGGCTRTVPLPCSLSGAGTPPSMGKHEEDRFYVIDNVRLPDGPQTAVQAESASHCEAACLSNCSCLAYSYNGTCSLWHGDLMNLQEDPNTGDSIFIRLPASEIPRPKSTRGRTIGVAVGVSTLALGVCLVTLFYLLRRRRTTKRGLHKIDTNLTAFRYKDLQLITKNFSDRLGAGSFGSVFKGVLQDGTAVAIKRLEGVRQGEKQFRAEMSTIGNIHHVNLIRLLGFCAEGEHRLLVYEYMPHGSLDACLFNKVSSDDGVLPWSTRYQIAIGVAKGLTYLHDKCRDRIIHCDIKPHNILLDASFAPKVSDFGLAKLLGRDFSRVITTMRGTIGYLAPEWISGTPITAKADVFSYGMMLFEIISQKRNAEHGKRCMDKFFPIQVVNKIQEGDLQALLDSDLRRDVNLEELQRACMVACWCVQEDESSRPTMGAVVQILEGLLQVNKPPVPRYLEVLAESLDQSVYS